MSSWEVVIGMEVHVQPRTRSKMFCGCAVGQLGDPPNSNVCEICAGMPGVLPVINKAAVEACLEWALLSPDQLIGIEPVREQPTERDGLR